MDPNTIQLFPSSNPIPSPQPNLSEDAIPSSDPSSSMEIFEPQSSQQNDSSDPFPEIDKGQVIMDVMNVILRMRGFEDQMKIILQEMHQSIVDDRPLKDRIRQYVDRFSGEDANLCRQFVAEDLQRDILHQVKINNSLAVVEKSIDIKTECIDDFSHV